MEFEQSYRFDVYACEHAFLLTVQKWRSPTLSSFVAHQILTTRKKKEYYLKNYINYPVNALKNKLTCDWFEPVRCPPPNKETSTSDSVKYTISDSEKHYWWMVTWIKFYQLHQNMF